MTILGEQHDHKQMLAEVTHDLTVRDGTKLPKRVFAAIAKHDDASEVLIKIIQFLIVFVFGILFMASPRTDAATSFALAPYAIGLYLMLTGIGLAWSLNRRLPDWAVYISIMFDVALLMILIWSFHIQYGQPASFYLKAPTLLYIFIFICLRALRFRARFVVAAGLIAALGWLTMIGYVVYSDPEDTMITRNYISYMTSNSILLGAEFDKIISILMVTGVLALVLHRGRKLLIQAISEQAAAQDFSRFFDASVATQIRGTDHQIVAGEGIVREAAILNVDIRGFTVMAAGMPADDVMTILTEYQRRLVPIIQANGGTIDKFLGDGIMATFGATIETATFAADALRGVDAIMAETGKWQQERTDAGLVPLNINASVATGPIVFGAVGDENRLEYTVIGSAVNLSAKLEKFNKDLFVRAVSTQATLDLARQQGYVTDRSFEVRTETIPGVSGDHVLVILES